MSDSPSRRFLSPRFLLRSLGDFGASIGVSPYGASCSGPPAEVRRKHETKNPFVASSPGSHRTSDEAASAAIMRDQAIRGPSVDRDINPTHLQTSSRSPIRVYASPGGPDPWVRLQIGVFGLQGSQVLE
jgi:hypothetical protein